MHAFLDIYQRCSGSGWALRFISGILITFVVSYAHATMPAEVIELTTELQDKYGFRVKVENYSSYLVVTLHYPETIDEIQRVSGAVVLLIADGDDDHTLMMTNIPFSKPDAARNIIATLQIYPEENDLQIGISYNCDGGMKCPGGGNPHVQYYLDGIRKFIPKGD